MVQDGRFVVADLSDPARPQILWQSRRLRSLAAGVALELGRAYLTEANNLLIWDTTDPLAPIEVGSYPLDGALQIVVEGRTIYFLKAVEGELIVRTIDATRPYALVENGVVTVPWTDFEPYHVAFDSDYFLVHDHRLYLVGQGRIWVADLEQPAAGLITLDVPSGVSSHLAAGDDRLYVSTDRGMFIFDLGADTPTLTAEGVQDIGQTTHLVGRRAFSWWQVCGWEPTDEGGVSGGCGYGIDIVDFAVPTHPYLYKHISIAPMGSNGNLLPDGPPWIDGTALFGSLFYLYTADYSVEQGWVPDRVWVLDLSPFMPISPEFTFAIAPPSIQTRRWRTGPVLVQFNESVCVDVCSSQEFSALPDLILYADGRLISNQYSPDGQSSFLREDLLDWQETCAFLNTVEALGFTDYDPGAYYELNRNYPRLMKPIYMEVNAWHANQVDAGGLIDFLEGGLLAGEADIDPALISTYELLRAYVKRPLTPYQPERLIVSITRVSSGVDDTFPLQARGAWPLARFPLANLYQRGRGIPNADPNEQSLRLFVDGAEGEALFVLFGKESEPASRIYSEAGERYEIAVRPLLPFENFDSVGYAYGSMDVIPSPSLPIEQTPIRCAVEDGVLVLYYTLTESSR